ncbi:MAG: diaminopimelate decarboxylase [Spirochaetaceae bacterium]
MKSVPFSREFIESVAQEHPTPFHIYDESAIRENARALNKAFTWVKRSDGSPGGFTNFFAVKALPNPHVMSILREEGMGMDCSSLTELMLAEKVGIRGEEVMFTSNDTPLEEYQKAMQLGAIVNLDDISHIPFLQQHLRVPELVCMRYNPGSLKRGNVIIGKPEEAKYGFTREQILEGYRTLRDLGAKRFGLHTMVASNELDPDYFIETAKLLFDLVVEIQEELGIRIEFVNLGGGIGIPYRPEQRPVDYQYVSDGVRRAYDRTIVPAGLDPLRIVMENGRVITGPYGYLVSRVIHLKETYKNYIGLDGNMANLMRPGMYGAYHHITVLGKENEEPSATYDVTGSLCENNDKFAIDRELPEVEIGDILVIHDTGAHGHSMGFNYNGKLRSAELLMRPDGSIKLIRRKERPEDLFATIVWD